MDYIFRWLASKFLSPEQKAAAGVIVRDEPEALGDGETGETDTGDADSAHGVTEHTARAPEANGSSSNGFVEPTLVEQTKVAFLYQQDAPSCHECGAIMVRNGACYKCLNCGSTSGCS
jgi:ribonucleoside-diphosphate reductase alpha chain